MGFIIDMRQAYLYKWTEMSTNKWYIGSRTAKNCHLNDGYICTSKIVKPKIIAEPNNWKKEILCIGNPEYILNLEYEYLTLLDAANDINSYNQCNGNNGWYRTNKPGTYTGKKHTKFVIEKIKNGLANRTPEQISKHKENMSIAQKKRKRYPHSLETKRKIAMSRIGKKFPRNKEDI